MHLPQKFMRFWFGLSQDFENLILHISLLKIAIDDARSKHYKSAICCHILYRSQWKRALNERPLGLTKNDRTNHNHWFGAFFMICPEFNWKLLKVEDLGMCMLMLYLLGFSSLPTIFSSNFLNFHDFIIKRI